jgi:predicted metal-dependent peptidase
MLTKAGFEIPVGGLLDDKYDGEWSTDQVYDELIKNQTDFDTSGLMLDLNEEGTPEDDGGLGSSITNTIVRARTQAQISGEEKAGLIPDEILRRIDELLNPKLPWQVILYRFLDQRIRDEYSWARRNRRYHTAYMPSMYNYGLGNLTFAIDTSGSIDDDALKDMLSEIQGIQQVFNPEAMTIIDCDSQIHQIHEIDQNTNIMDLQFAGGGGTRFQPVLDYVEQHPTQALIYFTDLEGEGYLKDVECPVIWICTSDHEPSSIGETIYMNN